jgi:hypothetical protein
MSRGRYTAMASQIKLVDDEIVLDRTCRSASCA